MDNENLVVKYGIESSPEFQEKLRNNGLDAVRAYVKECAVDMAIYPEDAINVDTISLMIWNSISTNKSDNLH